MEELFEGAPFLKVCAPMVRYSRLPFRLLVRDYDCDLAFTPMLMSDSFIKSERYREIEYTTCQADDPVIIQFAASNPKDFVDATEFVYGTKSKGCVGVDLNCGCPQSWATKEGIGACMMNKPEVISDILKQARNRIPDNNFSISCKVRIFLDMPRTIDLARQLEATGISFLSVHGRTKDERAQPVHLEYIKAIVDSLDIPVIANGDVDSLEKAYAIQEATGAKGVMSASGILDNPALYSGYEKTPLECIWKWVDINEKLETHFTMFHRHLIHMCSPLLSKAERKVFNGLSDRDSVIQFVKDKFEYIPRPVEVGVEGRTV